MIPYGKQFISEADIEAVVETLKADFLTGGPRIKAFEEAFANYIGAKYAVAVANGTAALHLSAMALGVKKGQKVITTPNTFVASANCILYCGGEIELVDIDPETYLLDIDLVRQKLENAPKGTYQGIVPVDFGGAAVDLEGFRELADEYDCWILEDACHAPGGYFIDSQGNNQNCGNGNFADLAIFSFHPVKHIATGEGGMITTNNPDYYQKLLSLRTHGITRNPNLLHEQPGGWYYEMQDLGYNYRLSDIHAALGLSQLSRAKENLEKRKYLARRYDEAFKNTKVITPKAENGHAYHLYVIRIENRKGLYDFLRQYKIFAQVHYIPVHYQPYYQQLGWKKGDFPRTEKYYDTCLSIPLFPTLTEAEQDFVIEKILEFID